MRYTLQTLALTFEAIAQGRITSIVEYANFFEVGDELVLQEYRQSLSPGMRGVYTGREQVVVVTHVERITVDNARLSIRKLTAP